MWADYYGEETQGGGTRGRVRSWHMVRVGETVAMCGKPLSPGGTTLPEEEWGRPPEMCCHTCGAMYLREVR
jgi:hypothetical protein